MNRILQYSILTLLFVLAIGIMDAEAQSRRKKKKKRDSNSEYFDDSGNFASRLWYGGNLNLGFSNNFANIGISPMIGYKFIDEVSFGPRFTINYTTQKLFAGNQSFNLNSTDFGAGAFGRGKIFNGIFAHVEFEYISEEIPAGGVIQIDPDNPNRILTERAARENFYIGGGYNSSGQGSLFGFEIMILFNTLEPSDSDRVPLVYRFGFTYNF